MLVRPFRNGQTCNAGLSLLPGHPSCTSPGEQQSLVFPSGTQAVTFFHFFTHEYGHCGTSPEEVKGPNSQLGNAMQPGVGLPHREGVVEGAFGAQGNHAHEKNKIFLY